MLDTRVLFWLGKGHSPAQYTLKPDRYPTVQLDILQAFKAQECEQCGENNNGLDNSDQASAAHCLSSCMELFRAGRLDDVIGYLSQDLMVHTVVKKGPT